MSLFLTIIAGLNCAFTRSIFYDVKRFDNLDIEYHLA